MRVVQKDSIISGMLEDERERSAAAVQALAQKASEYPKGSINFRKVRGKGKEYSYPFLKFREGGKSVFKHIPPPELESVLSQIQKRKKIEEEIKRAKQRIDYLDHLIASGVIGPPRKKRK